MKKTTVIISLLVLIVLAFLLAPFLKSISGIEGFHPLSPGSYPRMDDKPILNDYPLIGSNDVSNNSASTMWWHYPTLKTPSFTQITNNLRYFKNPDIGTCTRPEFCGALYHDKKNKTNVVSVLPPVPEGPGVRVGYFRSDDSPHASQQTLLFDQ